jgi:hypothetical protein
MSQVIFLSLTQHDNLAFRMNKNEGTVLYDEENRSCFT